MVSAVHLSIPHLWLMFTSLLLSLKTPLLLLLLLLVSPLLLLLALLAGTGPVVAELFMPRRLGRFCSLGVLGFRILAGRGGGCRFGFL